MLVMMIINDNHVFILNGKAKNLSANFANLRELKQIFVLICVNWRNSRITHFIYKYIESVIIVYDILNSYSIFEASGVLCSIQ